MSSNLPTYEQILERVKALRRSYYGAEWDAFFGYLDEANAQAIQAAMVEALRWAEVKAEKYYAEDGRYFADEFREAADALEKECATPITDQVRSRKEVQAPEDVALPRAESDSGPHYTR